jgi:hypothetical protein
MLSAFYNTSVVFRENPVHRADGTIILALIKKRGIDLIRCIIQEALGMQDLDHGLSFSSIKGLRGLRSHRNALLGWTGVAMLMPVKCGSGHLQRVAGRLFTNIMAQR